MLSFATNTEQSQGVKGKRCPMVNITEVHFCCVKKNIQFAFMGIATNKLEPLLLSSIAWLSPCLLLKYS